MGLQKSPRSITEIGTTEPFSLQLVRGNIFGHSVVHKFGGNSAVGTTLVPLAPGGVYQTPQVGGATTLRVKAGGNAADTALGAGAQEMTLQGLDETGALVTETVATAGASASAATTTTFLRLFRVWVSASGTYATQSAGSHVAAIVIENNAGTADWATIVLNGFPEGQSEIGVYSIPLGYTGFVTDVHFTVSSTKVADIYFFKRENILETAAPYSAMRVMFHAEGITDNHTIVPQVPYGPFLELTDLGFMAVMASGTSEIDVEFTIILIKNSGTD